MGSRYLKVEETVIVEDYPFCSRAKILEKIPGRTWEQIGVHARSMGVHRTSQTWGNSVREGRKHLPDSWTLAENLLLNQFYPQHTRAEICAALPRRAWKAIRCHARRLDTARTREAKARQIQIGRGNARKEEEERTQNEQKRNI
jgi:hypothetical protein